jgi:hypothetical protein
MSATSLLDSVLTRTQAAPKRKFQNAVIMKRNMYVITTDLRFECNGISLIAED